MTEGDKKEAPLSSHLELNLSNLFKILLSLLIHPICETVSLYYVIYYV